MTKLLFENLEVYKIANKLGESTWNMVNSWDWFAKDTLGKQLVRSADSISFNICEGYGRYYYKEKKLFYFYSRGSLYEVHEGLKKASARNLISLDEFVTQSQTIQDYAAQLNAFINSVGVK